MTEHFSRQNTQKHNEHAEKLLNTVQKNMKYSAEKILNMLQDNIKYSAENI